MIHITDLQVRIQSDIHVLILIAVQNIIIDVINNNQINAKYRQMAFRLVLGGITI